MLFHVMDMSELIKFLNQSDLFILSQVNHHLYNVVKPYLAKLYNWIRQRCSKFTLIYQVGKQTKADDKLLKSLKGFVVYITSNLFDSYAGFPLLLNHLISLNNFRGIREGDVINVLKLRKGKLKYRASYVFFNKNAQITYKDKENIILGPTLSTYPPFYWSGSFPFGICYENDIGIVVTQKSLEYNTPFGFRYTRPMTCKSKSITGGFQYFGPNKSTKISFYDPIPYRAIFELE